MGGYTVFSTLEIPRNEFEILEDIPAGETEDVDLETCTITVTPSLDNEYRFEVLHIEYSDDWTCNDVVGEFEQLGANGEVVFWEELADVFHVRMAFGLDTRWTAYEYSAETGGAKLIREALQNGAADALAVFTRVCGADDDEL